MTKRKRGKPVKPVFRSDFREENPKLHALHVKWALIHLTAVGECYRKLTSFSDLNTYDFSDLNTYDFAQALGDVLRRKLQEDAAYAEASEILDSITNVKEGFVDESYREQTTPMFGEYKRP